MRGILRLPLWLTKQNRRDPNVDKALWISKLKVIHNPSCQVQPP